MLLKLTWSSAGCLAPVHAAGGLMSASSTIQLACDALLVGRGEATYGSYACTWDKYQQEMIMLSCNLVSQAQIHLWRSPLMQAGLV